MTVIAWGNSCNAKAPNRIGCDVTGSHGNLTAIKIVEYKTAGYETLLLEEILAVGEKVNKRNASAGLEEQNKQQETVISPGTGRPICTCCLRLRMSYAW